MHLQHPDSDDPLFDEPTERDLRRIETNKLYFPPPADPEHPLWRESWAAFDRLYTPALTRFIGWVLRGGGPDQAEDAEDITREFICKRIKDGRLNPGRPIRSFRNWLAKQARRFVLDRLGRQVAQKRRPPGGFASEAALTCAPDTRITQDVLDRFAEGVADNVVRVAINRVRLNCEKKALILEDLVRNAGQQSADIAELIDVEPRRLTDLRRRAREAFRKELLAIARLGLFAEADIEDLIRILRLWFGSRTN